MVYFNVNSKKKMGEMKDERDKMFIEMKNLQREYQALNASFKHFAVHVLFYIKITKILYC